MSSEQGTSFVRGKSVASAGDSSDGKSHIAPFTGNYANSLWYRELDTLAVSIEHQSKGIGTMLLQQLLARCNEAGPDAVCTTMCDALNKLFFEKHGFQRASSIDVTTSYTEHGAEMECDHK